MRKRKEYALYKGDICLAIGTLEELSNKFDVKVRTLLFYQYPSYLKRRKKSSADNYRILVRIDEK